MIVWRDTSTAEAKASWVMSRDTRISFRLLWVMGEVMPDLNKLYAPASISVNIPSGYSMMEQ